MDDTLYPKNLGICKNGWERLFDVFRTDKKDEFGISHISIDDYKTHGDELLRRHKNFDWDSFMAYVCENDVSSIKTNHKLKEFLTVLPHKKIIYTDADYRHMNKVLQRLEVENLFDQKFTCFDAEFHFKPSEKSFNSFFEKTKINPLESAFFEDSSKNLAVAKKYGMMTILISEEQGDKAFCDFTFPSIEQALEMFK
ncbi:MAG: HAD hydrolase-like protein [Alphaproteobacteria bacterium]|nr:HAD hydrolase-like protein [Alphaproteobacteria bacterium]